MTQDRTENSRAPPMRHNCFKMAPCVSDTYEMCNCFILSCCMNVLIYRNIHCSKNLSTHVEATAEVHVFLDFPSYLALSQQRSHPYSLNPNQRQLAQQR